MTTGSRARALVFAAAAALAVLSTSAGVVHFASADSSAPAITTTSTSTTTTSTTTTSTTLPPTTSTAPPTTVAAVHHSAPATTSTTAPRHRPLGPVYDQCDVAVKILQSNPDHMFVTVVDALHPNTNIMMSVAWVTPDTAWTFKPDHAWSQSDANGKAVVDDFIIDDWLSGRQIKISASPVADYANACEPRTLTIDYSNPASFTLG